MRKNIVAGDCLCDAYGTRQSLLLLEGKKTTHKLWRILYRMAKVSVYFIYIIFCIYKLTVVRR